MATLILQPRGPAGPRQPGLLSADPARNPRPEDGVEGDYWLNQDTTVLFRKTGGKWAPCFNVRGPQGKPGEAGSPGKSVLYGASPPTVSIGRVGEFYIQTDGANPTTLYGPKTSSGWVSGTPLRGRGVLYGTGAPPADIGADGDFYIATNTWTIYGPRAGGAWPAGTPMTGPAGPYVEWTGGAWSGAATYAKGDGVDHLGSSFVSLHDSNIGNEPVTSPEPATNAHWQLVAAKGDTGSLAGADALIKSAQAYSLAFGG